ncbi:glycosyl hydrolase [Maribellus comscasis]|uniref:alpha-L-fucosidase n=1 Tax=Maribellus comscasis TaxID=2681766 RepID=A0A6I6K5E0_9BACT|nr:alpha-L-fucosidase [Maribellus comscasis]QGY45224.1 glycosyl hydrolase [Maribellus comscasis]
MKQLGLFFGILFLILSCAPKNQEQKDEATLKQDAKMEWWRDARFGMFVHWGLYAIPAGEWKGKEIPGISEWIMARAEIPVKDYEKLTEEFNPVKYNAEEWVKLAKFAGMKYIVITSKHHDGFAMFHSKASPYNIVDATPFDRDPLKELADACEKYGIRLGFYYSQAQDWHEPGGTYYNIEQGEPHWDPDLKREPLMNYINGKAVPQVKEILENYGGLDILWWDTPRGMTEEAAKALQAEVDKYPEMLTNNRLYRPWPGDFSTPEQHVPPTGLDYDWEVCMTMNTSWGYKKNDDNWKSSESLIRMLVDIASKGGNLLLNVGPTAEGLIPEPSVERLKEIGQWMQKNGESVYGTSASPFFKLPWGRCTTKEAESGNLLYLHVFDWPRDGVLRVPGLDARIKDVYLLTNKKQKFSYKFEGEDLLIHAPSVIFDPINTVVVVKTGKKMEITSNMPSLKDGKILMPADFADIHNPGYGTHAVLSGSGTESVIQNWVDHRARLEWMFNAAEAGNYRMEVLVKAEKSSKLNVKMGDKSLEAEIPATNDKFEIVNLGEIEINETDDKIISLTPVQENWGNVGLMYLELIKI